MDTVKYGELRSLIKQKKAGAEHNQRLCEGGGNVEGAAYWRGQAHALNGLLEARRDGALRAT